jgi:hypothetical protein|tara:strand:- start:1403 stop:1675 length:273 start_codon:yes stop_codon:yes gene_type:complete
MAHRFEQIQPPHCYTKQEVDNLIKDAIEEAMRKHNRNASLISMTLGILFLAAFTDGFFRAIGVIPPFMNIDINLMNQVVDAVTDKVANKL